MVVDDLVNELLKHLNHLLALFAHVSFLNVVVNFSVTIVVNGHKFMLTKMLLLCH